MNKKYRFLLATVVFLASLFAVIQANAAGEVDPTFNAQAYRGKEASVIKIVSQTDGKILVGGIFRVVNGVEKCAILRLNADRTVDNSFSPPEIYIGPFLCNAIQAIAVQTDGKIIIGGTFFGTRGNTFAGIRRLNPDGSIDPTFNTYADTRANSENVNINYIEVQTNGKILVSGNFTLVNQNASYIARLNADGTVDSTFPVNGFSTYRILKLQADGKILFRTGLTQIQRFNPDISLDSTFQTVNVNQQIRAVEIDSAGKIYLAGDFTTVNGFNTGNVVRLNSDGSLDASFNFNNSIYDLKIDSNGKVLIAGNFTQFNGTSRYAIVRLNSNGTLDTSFTSPFNANSTFAAFSILPLPDGKILLGTNGFNANLLYLLNSDGSFDNSFNVIVGSSGMVNEILQQPDGKILIGGNFRFVNGNTIKRGIARFNADGTVDNTFSQTTEQDVTALALQTDGKILVGRVELAAGFPLTNLIRLNPDGSPDPSFNAPTNNLIYDIKVLPNGKILVAGTRLATSPPQMLERRNADGTLDNTFTPTVGTVLSNNILKMKVQADGKILIAGTFSQINGTPRGNFARLNADGTLDSSFNPPFGANDTVFDLDCQSNGKIIIVGKFTGVNGNNSYKGLARINTDGSLDTSFPAAETNSPTAVTVQTDDKIIVAETLVPPTNMPPSARLFRLNPNGTLDTSLVVSANSPIAEVYLQNDGNILIGGEFTRVNNTFRTTIARILNAAPQNRVKFDYDGDGKGDISVFRPSNGAWYIQRSTNGFIGITFGFGSDIIVPADYDGDGKTDVAVFRPSNGSWYYLKSSTGAFVGVQFGQNGDIPIPGDYDGDGKADISVFRPANGSWYRLNSSTGAFYAIQFGQNGDKPLLADFDGDGKNEIAVFRPSNGTFYWLESSTGQFKATAFGLGTDILVLADYDGDSKTDISVFRPSNGAWYRLNSTTGVFIAQFFGQNGDIPVPADYDGDGKANLAVFRPTTNSWYIARPTGTPAQNFDTIQFGVGTDKPTPAAFQQ